jgi:hypothetical protein
MGFHTRRVPVGAEALVASSYDYADSFELVLDAPDVHAAEEWVRTGLEGSGAAVRGLIRFVHGRIARFDLTDSAGNVLGWRVLESADDVVHLRTEGPMLRAEIVARRSSPTVARFTTYLFYKHRRTPLLWAVIGPLHRRIAPLLLRRAAATLTRPPAYAHRPG